MPTSFRAPPVGSLVEYRDKGAPLCVTLDHRMNFGQIAGRPQCRCSTADEPPSSRRRARHTEASWASQAERMQSIADTFICREPASDFRIAARPARLCFIVVKSAPVLLTGKAIDDQGLYGICRTVAFKCRMAARLPCTIAAVEG